MRKFGLGVLAAAALLSLATSARADLTGDTVDVQYNYTGTPPSNVDVGDVLVSGSTTYGNITISITGDEITFTANSAQSFQAASFNGFTITDTTENPNINGVSVVSSPISVEGNPFSSSIVTFTGDEISFNFQGENWCNCSGTDSATYLLSFGANNVPEPPTVALLGAALAGLGLFFAARRRKNRNSRNATTA